MGRQKAPKDHMNETAESQASVGGECPPHRWVMANGWRRLSDIRYVCSRCGVERRAAETRKAKAEEAPNPWPTWEELIAQP